MTGRESAPPSSAQSAPRQKAGNEMPNIGPLEIGIVLVIVLVIFGPKRLPELGKSMGKGLREFKGSITGDGDKSAKSSELNSSKAPAVDAEVVTENKA
jgi:sec-independent protein translocase protein TatA